MVKKEPVKKRRYGLKPRGNKDASCPFCGKILERPHTIEQTKLSGFTGGSCLCGAIFIFDESGSHGGEAIVEVMTAGCGGDWDKAWSLEPEVDYNQISLSYDANMHRISEPGDSYQPAGKLYFFIIIQESETNKLNSAY